MSANAFIGRQPIFDRDLEVVANELLYRNSNQNRAVVHDQDGASCATVVTAFLEMGIESLVGDGVAYLNLSRELLLSSHLEALPPDKVVIEVLEHVEAKPDVVRRLRALKSAGYTIALDDFIYRPDLAPLVKLADIIKIEVMDKSLMHQTLEAVRGYGCTLLAEKVEDQTDMELCRDAGFDLFQGYFLCRPIVVEGRRIPQNKLATLRLLAKLSNPDIDFDTLESLVSSDISLSFRLLRYLNSAHFALRTQLTDVRQALSLLGLSKLRAWVAIIALASIEDKPEELVRIGIVRARMCELLAEQIDVDPATAFTVGLFSILDSLLDEPMASVLAKLPLCEVINRALVSREGRLGELIGHVEHYEGGRWDVLATGSLSPSTLSDAYLEANRWTMAALSGLK